MVRQLVKQASRDKIPLYRILIMSGGLLILIVASIVIIAPFIPGLLLAVIFTLSTWPAFAALNERLDHHPTVAAAAMTVFLALCFLLPLIILGSSLGDQFLNLVNAAIETLDERGHPPDWLRNLPVIGRHTDRLWDLYVTPTNGERAELRSPRPAPIPDLLLLLGAKIGRGVIDVSLGVLISFFMFRHGVSAARRLGTLLDRFLGPHGRHLLGVSKTTVIGVVYGMLGTALAQGLMAGTGFWIAGVPGAAILGLVTVFLSFIPAGPPFIWVPVTIWLFSQELFSQGLFMGLWGLGLVSTVDNIIRPWFISRGSNLPLLVVLIGLFGGVMAFGFIGFFIGPVVLAVAYTLVMEWSFVPPRRAFNMAAKEEGKPIRIPEIKGVSFGAARS